mmetsp:Transcript_38284/g.120599  ORF Transcript_38284/g.120599 Transcript_38284/m.120599 type:complete len:220 (+) Transcript_38284:855-1514(+)
MRYCTLPHNTRTAAPATRACAGLSPCACMSLAPRPARCASPKDPRVDLFRIGPTPRPRSRALPAGSVPRRPRRVLRPGASTRGRHEAVASQPADSRTLGQPSCLRSSWWMSRASRLHRSTAADSSDTPTATPSSSWRRCWRTRCNASCSALHSACCRRSVGTVARVCCGGAAVAPGSIVPSNGAAASGAESPPRPSSRTQSSDARSDQSAAGDEACTSS